MRWPAASTAVWHHPLTPAAAAGRRRRLGVSFRSRLAPPLAIGPWPLAVGRWPLAVDRWPLGVGGRPLAAGAWPFPARGWWSETPAITTAGHGPSQSASPEPDRPTGYSTPLPPNRPAPAPRVRPDHIAPPGAQRYMLLRPIPRTCPLTAPLDRPPTVLVTCRMPHATCPQLPPPCQGLQSSSGGMGSAPLPFARSQRERAGTSASSRPWSGAR